MINAQPMGFYAPAQLVQEAQRLGVEVRGIDVQRSDWECSLESEPSQPPALRLGLRLVSGLNLNTPHAEAVVAFLKAIPQIELVSACEILRQVYYH